MPYVLTLFVIAPHGELEISEEFYRGIKQANEALREIVAVEEKFDALMENFVELESTVLTLGARHLAFQLSDFNSFIEHRNIINRRIANFLSSGRLYRDALPQHVGRLLGKKNADANRFISDLKSESTQPVAFKMVEALRNYAQHRELPLSGLTSHSSREFVREETVAFSSWLEPVFDAVKVSQARDVKDDVKSHLVKAGENARAMPLLREYVEHVGAIHQAFRKLLKPREDAWANDLAVAKTRYREHFPEASVISLGAGLKTPNGKVLDIERISEDPLKYRRYLRIKHLTTANFSKRYVKWSK